MQEGPQGLQELVALPVRELRACWAGICGNSDFQIDFRSCCCSRNAGNAENNASKVPKFPHTEFLHHMLSLYKHLMSPRGLWKLIMSQKTRTMRA
jgi:hypothetical protein